MIFFLAFIAAVVAGAINSVAGGGTLLTYPTLFFAAGLPGKIANATNTMALWPASLAGAWGFRHTVPATRKTVLVFGAVSALGAITGAVLLKCTAESQFDAIVPWLILAAALLFLLQEQIMRRAGLNAEATDGAEPIRHEGFPLPALVFQFFVGVYGGYFGAGIGIIMLAAMTVMKVGGIYQMSFLKNLGALCINGAATVLFGAWGIVDWRYALLMASGALLGGYCGAGLAKKIGPRALRNAISAIGFIIAAVMIFRQFRTVY